MCVYIYIYIYIYIYNDFLKPIFPLKRDKELLLYTRYVFEISKLTLCLGLTLLYLK